MTLQQIQYYITVAQCGSVGKAAKKLFTSASTISESLSELEKEYNIQAFVRGSRGMSLTREGEDLLIELYEIQRKLNYLNEKYKNREEVFYSLSVVAQHHICGMDSFLSFVRMHRDAGYGLGYKESSTPVVLNSVEIGKSDIGILFYSKQSSKQFKKELEVRNLEFHKLLTGRVHAYVGESHPLAKKDAVTISELVSYPQINYDRQYKSNGEYTNIKREVPARQSIAVTDRATAYSLMQDLNAFVVGTGLETSMDKRLKIKMIPIADGDMLEIGYVLQAKAAVTKTMEQFIEILKKEISLHMQ